MGQGADESNAKEGERLALSRLNVSEGTPLFSAVEHASRISGQALGVTRVSVWLLEDDPASPPAHTLRCVHALQTPRDARDITLLREVAYPRYFEAIRTNRWVCADDAVHDPDTRELAESYLQPLGITSMLDAPILRGGVPIGIVCHEHVGKPRRWTQLDRSFAGSVGDILSLVFEQSVRLELEQRMRAIEIASRRAEKARTLARFALGLSHDFNNVLMAVRLATESLRIEAPGTAGLAHLETIDAATDAGINLTQSLFRFARSQSSRREHIDLVETVRSLEPLLRLILKEIATLRVDATSGPANISAAPSDVQQILLNLVSNAEHALDGFGLVRIAVCNEGSRVVLEVEDTGRGMTDDIKARMFEPFYSSYPTGMGWGLTTVRSIADELGASIEVRSAPGAGTTVAIAFPSADTG